VPAIEFARWLDRFRADINHDGYLSKDELLNHVMTNIEQHLKEGKQHNSQLFLLIDVNQDGRRHTAVS
jgi:Ca2+-binding EF-hand superfamily protein